MIKIFNIRLFEFFVLIGVCTAIYFIVSPKYFNIEESAEFLVFQKQYYTLKASAKYFRTCHEGFAIDPNFDNRKFDITDTNYKDSIEGIEKYIDVNKGFYFVKNRKRAGKFILTVNIFTGNIQKDFKEVEIIAALNNGLKIIVDDSNGIEDEWKILKEN